MLLWRQNSSVAVAELDGWGTKCVGGGGQVREILMAKVEGIEGILLQNFLKFSDVDSLILHCYHSRFQRTIGV